MTRLGLLLMVILLIRIDWHFFSRRKMTLRQYIIMLIAVALGLYFLGGYR